MILGIDPGLNCGWACLGTNGEVRSGVLELAPAKKKKFESYGMRWVRLRAHLNELAEQAREAGDPIKLIAYEEVGWSQRNGSAALMYAGIVSGIQLWCEENGPAYVGMPVQSTKKFATGKGNAGKDAMMKAAVATWPKFKPKTSDEADARWIAALAAKEYGGTEIGDLEGLCTGV